MPPLSFLFVMKNREMLKVLSLIKNQEEEDIDNLLNTLWLTREKGLSLYQKKLFISLLKLSSPTQLIPVLACLRSLIRKCVHDNLTSDDIPKLFPPDLPHGLRTVLIISLQKYQNQWKEESSEDQNLSPETVAHQVIEGLLPSFSLQDADSTNQFSRKDFGASPPTNVEFNPSHMGSFHVQRNADLTDNLGVLPRLKSMTWTLENRNKASTNKVAIITLKLQDYSKSPTGETEVKFQLTRDNLETMLKSMTCISEQLNLVGSSTEPSQKKQRQ